MSLGSSAAVIRFHELLRADLIGNAAALANVHSSQPILRAGKKQIRIEIWK
jgi:hypothetical protein